MLTERLDKMKYYIYIENGKINGAGQAKVLNENILNYETTQLIFEDYIENKNKYIWDETTQTIINNPNYEQEQIQKEAERKIEELKLKLEELDKQRIRALCEPSNRTDDQTWLEYYNEQIIEIRKELQSLQN